MRLHHTRQTFEVCAGIVTTIIAEDEGDDLKQVAESLGLSMVELDAGSSPMPDPNSDIDSAKKELEDLYNLM